MTPAQLTALAEIHIKINTPEDSSGKSVTPKANRANRVNKINPDDDRTAAVLAGIAAMKLPRKR